jgi:hypothetical protein
VGWPRVSRDRIAASETANDQEPLEPDSEPTAGYASLSCARPVAACSGRLCGGAAGFASIGCHAQAVGGLQGAPYSGSSCPTCPEAAVPVLHVAGACAKPRRHPPARTRSNFPLSACAEGDSPGNENGRRGSVHHLPRHEPAAHPIRLRLPRRQRAGAHRLPRASRGVAADAARK